MTCMMCFVFLVGLVLVGLTQTQHTKGFFVFIFWVYFGRSNMFCCVGKHKCIAHTIVWFSIGNICIFHLQVVELNTFFLKHIFRIPNPHPLNIYRLLLISLISAPTIRYMTIAAELS